MGEPENPSPPRGGQRIQGWSIAICNAARVLGTGAVTPGAGAKRGGRPRISSPYRERWQMLDLLLGGERGRPEAASVLKRVVRDGRPIRMELESDMIRFDTVLLLRRQIVLVGKPRELTGMRSGGQWVRFKVPWDPRFEVRMQVSVPHLNLSNGQSAFVCQMPAGRVPRVRRGSERFSTRAVSNLYLDLPSLDDRFRIVDLSRSGCRIEMVRGSSESVFRLKRRIPHGVIQLGDNMHVEIDGVVPRMLRDRAVGFEYAIDREGEHRRQLRTLLGALAMMNIAGHSPSTVKDFA